MKTWQILILSVIAITCLAWLNELSLNNNKDLLPQTKQEFESRFIKNIDETKIIKVNMEKSALSDKTKMHFEVNGHRLYSFINYKVESVEKDIYLALTNSTEEGNNCYHIANTKKQLYIWQQKRLSIITEESSIDSNVLEKPYCRSWVLPEGTDFKVKYGRYIPDDDVPVYPFMMY